MKAYKNMFEEKTDAELMNLYTQFLEFEKSGVISSDKELGKIRDQYCDMFNSGSPLVALERDLLHAIADEWYNDKINACGLQRSIGLKIRIRADLKENENYEGHCATDEMVQYAGKEATIVGFEHDDDCAPAYLLDIDGRFWSWSDQMFEELQEDT